MCFRSQETLMMPKNFSYSIKLCILSLVCILSASIANHDTFAQTSNEAVSSFNSGISALEKQQFRTATNAFRTAYLLDSANMTYLRHFAKALFYAEFNNIDSVRLAQELLRIYKERGGENNSLYAEKGKILTNDVNTRVDDLVQDSLRAAQRAATKYISQYQYSYRATAEKPVERPKDTASLAGKAIWTAFLHIQAGIMQQPNTLFDHWGEVSIGGKGAFWSALGEGTDIGGEFGLHGGLGAMLESGSIPNRIDTGVALRRLYSAEVFARCRIHFHTAGILALGAVAHAENMQTLGYTPENIAGSILQGNPFHLVGAGLCWEPRDSKEGLFAEGRYFFLPVLGTQTASRMITGILGYSFGRATLSLEGLYATRSFPVRSEALTTLALRVGLRWNFVQAFTEERR